MKLLPFFFPRSRSLALHRSFLKGHEEIFCFEIDSALSAFVWAIRFWNIQGSTIDLPSADVIEASSRMFIVQRITLVHQHHSLTISHCRFKEYTELFFGPATPQVDRC